MNPLAPLFVLAALAGPLVARRRAIGWAWLAVGLAATALLSPALAIPDGMPSPAAIAGAHAPWRGEVDPDAGNPALSDVAWQIQPWLSFSRQELRAGRLPLWNPFQYAGSPFWSNGQSAPLFPLHLLFAVVPQALGWLLLPWLKVMIGGLGAWWLGRQLGLSPPAALVAAVAYPLAGMPVAFLLYPLGSAVALAPWVLAAVERLAAGRWGLPPLAALAGLQLLAGHPETCLHTAMLAALYLLVRGTAPGVSAPGAWGRLVGGWVAAAALAAVHLLPFVATLVGSSRWLVEAEGAAPPARLLITLPLRLVLPDLYGDPVAGTWWGPYFDNSTAVYAGAATLVLAIAGLAAARWPRRRAGEGEEAGRRWAAVAAVLAFSLAAAYQVAGLRQLLDAVPLIDRALHHRLLFAVDLALALLAGAGLDRWCRGRGRRGLLTGAATVLLLLGGAWLGFASAWAERGSSAGIGVHTAWVAAVAVALAAAAWLPARLRPAVAWLLPAIVAADLVAAHAATNPGLSRRDFFPVTGAVEVLQRQGGRVIATGSTLRPNAATFYRLADVRGDDTVRPARVETFSASELGAAHPTYFVPVERWEPVALDRLGVRWVMTGPGEASPVAGAGLAYDGEDARLWEREGVSEVGWEPPGAECTVVEEPRSPARRSFRWRCAAWARLVVAETYDAGWRGWVAGTEVAVEPYEERFLAVALPAGEGRLELVYRPVGLVLGAVVSGAVVVWLAMAGWWWGWRGRG